MSDGTPDSTVGRWLQRPYVAHRFRTMGPQMSNAAVLGLSTFLQALWLLVWHTSPVEFPILIALIPTLMMGLLTSVLLMAEPVEQRREVV